MGAEIIHGDNRETLATLPARSFHCCVTSPPYWGLRDYGVDGQIGMEGTPDDFVSSMRATFAGVHRVLRDDGVLWLNLGDTYHQGRGARGGRDDKYPDGRHRSGVALPNERVIEGLKPKDLVGIPWRVAFALQEDGWYLRDAIIWHKPAPMPGSQRDRCTSSYEFIFQLTKSRQYFFDLDAIKIPSSPESLARMKAGYKPTHAADGLVSANADNPMAKCNRPGEDIAASCAAAAPRNVWTMASGGFKEAHFATFPIELPLRCIKASTSSKGCCSGCGAPWQRITERTALKRERPNEYTKRKPSTLTGGAYAPPGQPPHGNARNDKEIGNHCANTVAGVEARTIGWEPTCDCNAEVAPCRVLDPFSGAGTTGVACRRLGVDYVGCELNQEYIDMSYRRFAREANRDSTLKAVKPLDGQLDLFAEAT